MSDDAYNKKLKASRKVQLGYRYANDDYQLQIMPTLLVYLSAQHQRPVFPFPWRPCSRFVDLT